MLQDAVGYQVGKDVKTPPGGAASMGRQRRAIFAGPRKIRSIAVAVAFAFAQDSTDDIVRETPAGQKARLLGVGRAI